jgi:molybdenum cofactor biosynthesis protein B
MSHAHERTIPITAAIITVSSTRIKENDLSGKAIGEILKENTIPVIYYSIVPDNVEKIRDELFSANKNANCIIFNGGTGLTHDDCTIEAISPLLEKKLDGFGELFRLKSFGQVGLSSMLSRAIAGTSYGAVVFCIPGSTPAVTLATKELIVPVVTHILSHSNMPK